MNLIRIFILLGIFSVFALSSMAEESSGDYRLALEDALQKADKANLQVMMANARVEQAIARISQAQSDIMPHVDGIASGGRQTSDLRAEGIAFPGIGPHIGPYNDFDARARVTIALFDPSAFERFQAAKKGESLSRAELEKTREDVLGLVANLFVDAQRKAQTAGLLKKLLDKDQMAYEISENSLDQGTETELNSNRSKSDLDQTKYLYTQAKLQAENASLDLEAALQIPLDETLVLLDDDKFTELLDKNAAVNFKDVTNADLAMASSQLEASKADQKTALADYLPKVSGTADYGRLGESPSNGSNTYAVGVQVTVPIWDGGSEQANVKEAKANIKEAQENLTDAGQQQQVNIVKARAAMLEADDLKQSKVQARQTARRALLIAFHAEESGSGTLLGLMQAKADLALAEDDYNEAQAAWVMSRVDLLHAQGRLRDLVKTGE